MQEWNTPLINSLKGTDAASLQQIFRSMTAELHRLDTEIKAIKQSQRVNVPTQTLKLR